MKNPESDTEKSELTNALGLIFSLFADTHVRRISSIKSWLTHGRARGGNEGTTKKSMVEGVGHTARRFEQKIDTDLSGI